MPSASLCTAYRNMLGRTNGSGEHLALTSLGREESTHLQISVGRVKVQKWLRRGYGNVGVEI